MKPKKIVSGGQTGVDRAALDIAIKFGIEHGGWCPKGRRCESSTDPDLSDVIPAQYLLQETTTYKYSDRTKLNIRDSDGTLILMPSENTKITDGTQLTIREARNRQKPSLIVYLDDPQTPTEIADWIDQNDFKTLNIAGPRESQFKGIYELSYRYLEKVMRALLLFNEKRKVRTDEQEVDESNSNPKSSKIRRI